MSLRKDSILASEQNEGRTQYWAVHVLWGIVAAFGWECLVEMFPEGLARGAEQLGTFMFRGNVASWQRRVWAVVLVARWE
jgi:hypothetical protein